MSALVILDRDGVINRDCRDYVRTPEQWTPLPGSLEAIVRLNDAGYTVAVASNQSGLARGYFTRRELRAMHRKLRRLLAHRGGRIARIEVCPHGPDEGCRCRKPAPGLISRLQRRFGAQPSDVSVVGDSLRDLEAARAAGSNPVLVRTGNGRRTEAALPAPFAGVPVYDDLAAFVDAVVNTSAGA